MERGKEATVSKRFAEYLPAAECARRLVKDTGSDVAIRRVKEFSRDGYTVALACRMDSDYTLAEIVRPEDAW